jgi:hypothetical protein
MRGWGFFEWLVYGCFGVGAIVMAIDQAIKLSNLRELSWTTTITENNIWAFTPFAMLCISGGIILLRTISSSVTHPSISTPVIEKTDATKFELPKSLDTLTNHELRLTAYNLQSHVEALTQNYFYQLSGMRVQNISANERASRIAALDQTLNREFRATYADDILTLQKEIFSRTKDNRTPMEVTKEFPNRLLDAVEINQAVYMLAALSNQLQ